MKAFLVELSGWTGKVIYAEEYLGEAEAVRVASRTFAAAPEGVRSVAVRDPGGEVVFAQTVGSSPKLARGVA